MKVQVAQLQHRGERRREIEECCISIYLCLDQIQESSPVLCYPADKPFTMYT